MNEKLLKTVSESILSYIDNIETIDIDMFVKNICNAIIVEMNLQDEVCDVRVLDCYDKNPPCNGLLDADNNLFVFRDGVNRYLHEELETVSSLSDYEINLYRCILYVKTILHEFEHIKQRKLLKNADKNLDALIVNLCSKHDGAAYFCMYDCYPTERLADINALRAVVKIIEYLEAKIDIELLGSYIKKKTILEEFYNYYKYGLMGPTEMYFDFWNKDDYERLKDEKRRREMNLEERVLYGLEISRGEYELLVMRYAGYDEEIKILTANKKK